MDDKVPLPWLRVKAGTKSDALNIVPPIDHTSSDAQGYFMYVQGMEDVAGIGRLISPIVANEPDLKWCLTFWYFVQSGTRGTVRKLQFHTLNEF